MSKGSGQGVDSLYFQKMVHTTKGHGKMTICGDTGVLSQKILITKEISLMELLMVLEHIKIVKRYTVESGETTYATVEENKHIKIKDIGIVVTLSVIVIMVREF